MAVKQAVSRNEKGQEQVNKCWNIGDGEPEEGLERLQIQLMDITDTLVNVPIQEVEAKPVLQDMRSKFGSGSLKAQALKGCRKWKRIDRKENRPKVVPTNRRRLEQAGTKRPWRLQVECDKVLDIRETSGYKKLKEYQDEMLTEVEEASLKWPQLSK